MKIGKNLFTGAVIIASFVIGACASSTTVQKDTQAVNGNAPKTTAQAETSPAQKTQASPLENQGKPVPPEVVKRLVGGVWRSQIPSDGMYTTLTFTDDKTCWFATGYVGKYTDIDEKGNGTITLRNSSGLSPAFPFVLIKGQMFFKSAMSEPIKYIAQVADGPLSDKSLTFASFNGNSLAATKWYWQGGSQYWLFNKDGTVLLENSKRLKGTYTMFSQEKNGNVGIHVEIPVPNSGIMPVSLILSKDNVLDNILAKEGISFRQMKKDSL
jgi:hypothetical protein